MGDITVPGATVFTMMPSGASARERFFDALAIAAFAAVNPMSPGLWWRIDDAATFTIARERRLAEQRERGARRADHGEHAEVELVEPRGVGEVVEAADVRGPDRVHEHVALAPALVEERERGLDLAGVEQVALEPDGVVGAGGEQLLLRLAEVARRAGEHRDARALASRGARRSRARRRAVPPATTGRAPLQSEVHGQPLISARVDGPGDRRVSGSPVARGHEVVPPQRRAGREDVAARAARRRRAGRRGRRYVRESVASSCDANSSP